MHIGHASAGTSPLEDLFELAHGGEVTIGEGEPATSGFGEELVGPQALPGLYLLDPVLGRWAADHHAALQGQVRRITPSLLGVAMHLGHDGLALLIRRDIRAPAVRQAGHPT